MTKDINGHCNDKRENPPIRQETSMCAPYNGSTKHIKLKPNRTKKRNGQNQNCVKDINTFLSILIEKLDRKSAKAEKNSA